MTTIHGQSPVPSPRSAAGLVNLRDAGALPPPATGLASSGVLYRSEAPRPGDPAPTGLVWPPRTVIDLRETAERGPGPHPLRRPGTEVVHLALGATLAPGDQSRPRDTTLALTDLYLRLLDRGSYWMPQLIGRAARGRGPVLVHCAAGKDRTGIAVALLLAAAAVPRDYIVADYLRTGHTMPELRDRLHLAQLDRPEPPDHLLAVSAEAIDAVLDRVGPDPAGFLHAHGVAPADLRSWRHRLWPDRSR